MHSSRMRTARLLIVSRSFKGAVYLGGICPGVSAWGMSAQGDIPPWTELFTHACENITFAHLLLRVVKIRSQCYLISR